MLIFRLALRALRWRIAASATVFAVALIGIVAASVGPIYLHAVDQRILAKRLQEAPQGSRDVHVTRNTLIGTPGTDWPGPVRSLALQSYDKRWFSAPVYSEEAQVYYTNRIRYAGTIAAVDDLCQHVHIISGRCVGATSADDTVISARTAASQHLAVGDVIKAVPIANVKPVVLHVVGVITPIDVNGAFWRPWDLFNAYFSVFDNQLPRLDSFLVSHAALYSRTTSVAQTLGADLHLDAARVGVDDLPALRALVRRIETAASGVSQGGLTPTIVGTQLGGVLDGMRHEMSLSQTLITVPTVQLGLLAIFVLYAVVAGTASVQGPEVALAKLRGRRSRSVLLQGILQPILLILIAAPIGALLAWVIIRAVADGLLGGHVPVAFPPSAIAIAAVATGGGILAAVLAARRILVSPVGALLRRGTDTVSSRLGLAVFDGAAVVLAGAGLVELVAGGVLDSGKTDPLSALAPTLLAIAIAVLVIRLLPLAGRAAVRGTRDSRRIAWFLAVRQIVRRPAGARVLLLVGVALALATFAVTNWSVAGTNRHLRALNQAGAPTVYEVQPARTVPDLRVAVDRADPAGHSMAAAVVTAERATPLLAVDPARFAGVAAWQSNYAPAGESTVLATIAHPGAPSMKLTGIQLQLTVDLAKGPRTPIALTAFVTDDTHLRSAVTFGVLRRGTHTYTQLLNPGCVRGCRLTGLAIATNKLVTTVVRNNQLPSISLTVSGAVGRAGGLTPVRGLSDPASWRSNGQGSAALGRAASALTVTLTEQAPNTPWPALLSADVPEHLPAVIAAGTASAYPGQGIHDASAFGLDNASIPVDGLITAVTLPQVDRYGVMVDFGTVLDAMSSGPGSATHFQVWAGPGAPNDLPARLSRLGVHVTRTIRASTYEDQLDHTGPAFADGLFLVAAAAATALALGATVLGGIITARRRSYELAALQVAGVSPRTLRRATAGEQAILVAAGLLVGLVAGIFGSRLALPSTPFFVSDAVGPPSVHPLPWELLGALVAALVVVFGLTCVVVARLMARQATAGRLREAQQ